MSRRTARAHNHALAAELRNLPMHELRRQWSAADEQQRELQGKRTLIWREIRRREREARKIPPASPAQQESE